MGIALGQMKKNENCVYDTDTIPSLAIPHLPYPCAWFILVNAVYYRFGIENMIDCRSEIEIG
jgi:hypothetical protein